VKLLDCDARWIDFGDRRGVGLRFLLPAGPWRSTGIRVLFRNPLDDGPPLTRAEAELLRCDNKGQRWTRAGVELGTLTVTPSINAGRGNWHGNVTDGNVEGGLER
jgi:hypothetical protein